MRIDQVITGGGDRGETSLADGVRVPKTHPRVAALGDVDELNAAVGLAVAAAGEAPAVRDALAAVQQDLFDLGADLAVPLSVDGEADDEANADRPPLRVTSGQCDRLTEVAKAIAAAQPALSSFVLPGGSELAARLHLARTVCRRAERAVWALHEVEPVNPRAAVYLNRLSDLLFVQSRAANGDGAGDVLWVPGRTGRAGDARRVSTRRVSRRARPERVRLRQLRAALDALRSVSIGG